MGLLTVEPGLPARHPALLLLWPRERNPLHRALWLTVATVAVPTFFYQNSGWVQFGYRFSLDFLPFSLVLVAIGLEWLVRRWPGRTIVVAGGLVAASIAVNLWGVYWASVYGW
jgi:hypothetical protein